MSYDERESALEAADHLLAGAEGRLEKATADAKRKLGVYRQLQGDYDRFAADAKKLTGKKKATADKELRELKKRVSTARAAHMRCLREIEREKAAVHEAGLIRQHVERTFIPGCMVLNKPTFNLIAIVKGSKKKGGEV